MTQTLGELDAAQVRQLLAAHHLGRLTCPGGDRSRVLPIKYRVRDAEHIDLDTGAHRIRFTGVRGFCRGTRPGAH